MKQIIRALALALPLGAASCVTDGQPEIQTQIVKVAVPVSCKPALPERPQLMTRDEIKAKLAATPLFDDRVRLLTSQLLAYIGWVPVVEGALTGCTTPPGAPQH